MLAIIKSPGVVIDTHFDLFPQESKGREKLRLRVPVAVSDLTANFDFNSL